MAMETMFENVFADMDPFYCSSLSAEHGSNQTCSSIFDSNTFASVDKSSDKFIHVPENICNARKDRLVNGSISLSIKSEPLDMSEDPLQNFNMPVDDFISDYQPTLFDDPFLSDSTTKWLPSTEVVSSQFPQPQIKEEHSYSTGDSCSGEGSSGESQHASFTVLASSSSDVTSSVNSANGYPPTPPSSSDSEGSSSVTRPGSPFPTFVRSSYDQRRLQKRDTDVHIIHREPSLKQLHKMSNSGGILSLTDEERRTLESEGYPIPSKLPLSKLEERCLKKVRRKIKNKLSAQESRRKKKEYVETLERKIDDYSQDNEKLRHKVDLLENANRTLLSQLQKLQEFASGLSLPSASQGTCLMMFMFIFSLLFTNLMPYSNVVSAQTSISSHPSYKFGPEPPIRASLKGSTRYHTYIQSRVLLSVDDDSCLPEIPTVAEMADQTTLSPSSDDYLAPVHHDHSQSSDNLSRQEDELSEVPPMLSLAITSNL